MGASLEIQPPMRSASNHSAIRHSVLTSAFLLSLCTVAACSHAAPDLSGYTEEEPPPYSTQIQVALPLAARQLDSGWYAVEQGSWRWTARNFAVVLRRPIGADRRGAVLTLHFILPDAVLAQLKSVTLRAFIEGSPLAPETYRASGKQVYTRDVPASLLSAHTLRIDFALDRAFVPGHGDLRELGVIADNVGLDTR
jgi:hypothetical protein